MEINYLVRKVGSNYLIEGGIRLARLEVGSNYFVEGGIKLPRSEGGIRLPR